MKIILTIILSTFFFSSFGQKIRPGIYLTSKKDIGFESEIFEFYNDGTFNYFLFTCTGTGLGKGISKVLSNNSLQLSFTDCLNCSNQVQIESNETAADSLKINIILLDWSDKVKLSGVIVSIPTSKNGTVSDYNGQAIFNMNISNEDQNLLIQNIGYETINLKIPPNTTQLTGEIYLTTHWIYNKTEEKVFKIFKWNNSKLILKRYQDLEITYSKISNKKMEKIIIERMGEAGYNLYLTKFKR
ncbi:hypothetical protein [Flammeovirga kamogawensis]|uniref:Carboxypeptidase-like regulatory domain-containing protein n=1 Tax=Flammeovirga kamogawensis TaxID=373891 RepID=A0ABX8H3M1_9BACT|nr:hypothetical protein [Flammeovirga kamogawensis]MBB6464153.1 hypothetical protein [Flammeovirga kamogawensis]QWG09922.1 hypothetical protein KM029_19770 [Flammeovirga kamogawensis]TRX65432.1 hypothetical protein EO216_23195 [Flammeovirga kamogawensis]